MATRRMEKIAWRKRNTRRPDDIEIIVRDGFSRRRIDNEVGDFDNTVRNILARLDEKYNLAWNRILPKRFYDSYVEKKRRRRR